MSATAKTISAKPAIRLIQCRDSSLMRCRKRLTVPLRTAHQSSEPAKTPATAATEACSGAPAASPSAANRRSEEHTSELPSLMRISYAVFCLKKKKQQQITTQSEG